MIKWKNTLQEPQLNNDPFSIGQLIGIMVILTFVENNDGITKDFLDQLKRTCAEKSADALGKLTEDVYLIVDDLVKNIKIK